MSAPPLNARALGARSGLGPEAALSLLAAALLAFRRTAPFKAALAAAFFLRLYSVLAGSGPWAKQTFRP